MVDSGKEIEIRCYHCAGPLTKNLETYEWTVAPFIRDSFSMIGSAVGGTANAFIGFNHVMPIVRKWIKGPLWLHFLVGAPSVIVVASACVGLAGLDSAAKVALYRLWHSLPRRHTMQLFIHLSNHKGKRRTKYIS